MKWKSPLVTTAVITLVTSPFWGVHLLWRLEPIRPLDVLVVDYTVPKTRYSHHRGLFWLLNHLRVPGPVPGEKWRPERDYVGYHPMANYPHQRLANVPLDTYDWIYFADTYGVWNTDLLDPREAKVQTLLGPHLVYGALDEADAATLLGFVERGGNLILEFNILAEPTADGPRKTAESLIQVEWTGWCGRFYEELTDPETIPHWLPRRYEKQYSNRPFPSGPGILLAHKSGKVVVLAGQTFERSVPTVQITEIGQQKLSGPFATPAYYGWFSIVKPTPKATVLAEIVLPPIPAWQRDCFLASVPTVFPLLTRFDHRGSSRFYLAADTATMDVEPGSHQMYGLPLLQAAINRRRDSVRIGPVFWQFYVPVMGQILTEASQKKQTPG